MRILLTTLIAAGLFMQNAQAAQYDIAINNGRVIDPETGLDDIRHIGVTAGVIEKISRRPLKGETVIDATDLVVAPGFIDRNTYTLSPELFRARAADGVTTTFNFEEGAIDVPAAYAAMHGNALINYGFSASWGSSRLKVTSDSPMTIENGIGDLDEIDADEMAELAEHTLSEEEEAAMLALLETGLKAGAPAIGMGIGYFSGATNKETLNVFDLAAKYDRSVQVHVRDWNETTDHQDIYEVLAGAAITGAAIQVSHINSTSAYYIDIYLDYVARVSAKGINVTMECYPYTAGMNDIRSETYKTWREWPDERFAVYQWAETGERMTRELFEKYRAQGGFVIIHTMREEWIDACVAHKLTQIASDGGWDGGKTHPRVAGSNTRVLGQYVREKQLLSLNDAIRKMALLPALSLERAAPQMAKKGRLQKGMDADIVIFDPDTVIDRATYSDSVVEPLGMETIIVNGVVVKTPDGFVDGATPGQPIRAAIIN